jgi:5-methylthioadenosine/S-adenosylhomocysteine deaminase
MQRIDALICPRWTIRVEPQVAVETDLAIAVDAGRIVAVLPRAEAGARFMPDARHDRSQHVLMPGLVNAHCHAAMSLLRGFADGLPLSSWLEERIWPAESRLVSAEFVADGTRLAIAEMLRGGITCFADMYYYPEVVGEVALECGIRAALGMIALEFPTPWADGPDEYIRKGLAVHDRYKGEALITTTFAPHAPYSVADATLKRIRKLADELDVPVHMHVHETANEVDDLVAATGRRPFARLESLGLVNPSLMAVHATQLDAREIDSLAEAGASVVHCPRANMKLASGACPVAQLRRAGVNVALGTDGAAGNNRLDLLAELSTATLLGNLVAKDATAVSAAAAIEMATINGARALNLAGEIGSIVPGKAADLICIALDDVALQPILDPLSLLVYAAGREHVSDVWVGGAHLVSAREHVRLDTAAIRAAADSWAERLRGE